MKGTIEKRRAIVGSRHGELQEEKNGKLDHCVDDRSLIATDKSTALVGHEP